MARTSGTLNPAVPGGVVRNGMPFPGIRGRHRFAGAVLVAAVLAAGCSRSSGDTAGAVGRHDDGIRLTPDPPTVRTQLAVVLDVPNIDPRRCSYVWQRNGEAIAEATGASLTPDRFRKQDRVSVEVGIPGANGGAARTLRAETRVADSAPVVMGVQLALDNTGSSPVLHAHPDCQDPDGDELSYQFRWFRNGAAIDNASDSVLTLGALTPSDRITVEVVAEADRLSSAPVRSEAFAFDNRPPLFTAPPTALTPGQAELRYQALASDPDGDALHYELVEAPAGMTMGTDGIMVWPAPANGPRQGEYTVRLRVKDGKGGEATQAFVIRMSGQGPAQAQATP